MLEWLTKRNKKKKNHVGEQQNNNTREKQKQLVSHNLYLCREERGRGAELESVCVRDVFISSISCGAGDLVSCHPAEAGVEASCVALAWNLSNER